MLKPISFLMIYILNIFLNKEIKMTYGINDERVIVGSLINPDGTVTENIENKIILSIINLEHETTVKSMQSYTRENGNSFIKKAPPVHLNLYVLVSANYDSGNYLEALKMLSSVIGVFQANTYFTLICLLLWKSSLLKFLICQLMS